MSAAIIHFVSLENNKMFLHVSEKTEWSDIRAECLEFAFCQENAPIKVVYSANLSDCCNNKGGAVASDLPDSVQDRLASDLPDSVQDRLARDLPDSVQKGLEDIIRKFQDMFGDEDVSWTTTPTPPEYQQPKT